MRISDWSSYVCSSDLTNFGISYSELGEALEKANLAVGANFYNRGGEAYLVRVDARARSVDEIRNAVAATRGGVAITVGQIANVRIGGDLRTGARSEEHTSELQSLMRISYAVFCLKKNTKTIHSIYS